MANNLFISYDLYNPGKDYARVIETIEALGNWAKVHKSVWHVKSTLSCEQAANKISDTSRLSPNSSFKSTPFRGAA